MRHPLSSPIPTTVAGCCRDGFFYLMAKPNTAKLINGKKLAGAILLELKTNVANLATPPGLAAILVGEDPASHRYVQNKKRACSRVGIELHEYLCGKKCYPDITQAGLLELVAWLNRDREVDGIIVQLPLPAKFDTGAVINAIDPKKDVDGFHPKNRTQPQNGPRTITPPLIAAIRLALQYTGENLAGKQAVVVAKNPVFFESLLGALTQQGLVVSQIKPDDPGLAAKTRDADILVTIAGKKKLIKKSMVKPHAIVIDAGTTMVGKDRFVGDVEPAVAEVADWLTPVPGGIGPLTVAMLLKNTCDLHGKE